MVKNDNAHSVRLVESLRKNVGYHEADEFEESKTWCYCTLGNAEGIFQEVFKKDIKVTLMKSIKTGGDKCVIAVEW